MSAIQFRQSFAWLPTWEDPRPALSDARCEDISAFRSQPQGAPCCARLASFNAHYAPLQIDLLGTQLCYLLGSAPLPMI